MYLNVDLLFLVVFNFRFHGVTAVTLATSAGHLEVVKFLLMFEHSESQRNSPSPLVAAVAHSWVNIVVFYLLLRFPFAVVILLTYFCY